MHPLCVIYAYWCMSSLTISVTATDIYYYPEEVVLNNRKLPRTVKYVENEVLIACKLKDCCHLYNKVKSDVNILSLRGLLGK